VSEFYTVTIEREKWTSTFDAAGKKISDTVTWIPETYRDLPYVTAMAYVELVPRGRAEIIRQYADSDNSRFDRLQKDTTKETVDADEIEDNHDRALRRHVGETKDTADAAKTGDMAAAITAELEAS
jgi:hypothetical protein